MRKGDMFLSNHLSNLTIVFKHILIKLCFSTYICMYINLCSQSHWCGFSIVFATFHSNSVRYKFNAISLLLSICCCCCRKSAKFIHENCYKFCFKVLNMQSKRKGSDNTAISIDVHSFLRYIGVVCAMWIYRLT